MMQFWLVLLGKWAAASSTRLSFCLALIHSLTAACEVLTSPVSDSSVTILPEGFFDTKFEIQSRFS